MTPNFNSLHSKLKSDLKREFALCSKSRTFSFKSRVDSLGVFPKFVATAIKPELKSLCAVEVEHVAVGSNVLNYHFSTRKKFLAFLTKADQFQRSNHVH